MEELLFFLFIYTNIIFVWSYIFARRKRKDRATNSFLLFLGVIIIWMILSTSNFFGSGTFMYINMQRIYWILLLNMAPAFLYFIYALLNKRLDFSFKLLVFLNTFTIIVRYFFELDYTKENFWRLEQVKVATVMATIFTLPMVWAVVYILSEYKRSKDYKTRKSLKLLLYGLITATIISIISEYIGPVFIPQLKTSSYMYLSILTLVIFLVLAVVKEQFLNVEIEYIYEELFLNSIEGIILIDNNGEIISINDSAKAYLEADNIKKGMILKDVLCTYEFNKDNERYEISINKGNGIKYLSLSQNVIEVDNKKTMKLVHIINITDIKQQQMDEINILSDKSYKDQLTNLYNRRFLNEKLLTSNQISNEDIIIIFIDIDDLKAVNDNYGHCLGDTIIKVAAQSIEDNIRANEIAIRYGGDEFIIVLKDVKEEDASKVASRINNKFQEDVMEVIGNNKLSMSMGISRGKGNIDKLIHEADKAMYYSKSSGKDQFSIFNMDYIEENR